MTPRKTSSIRSRIDRGVSAAQVIPLAPRSQRLGGRSRCSLHAVLQALCGGSFLLPYAAVFGARVRAFGQEVGMTWSQTMRTSMIAGVFASGALSGVFVTGTVVSGEKTPSAAEQQLQKSVDD